MTGSSQCKGCCMFKNGVCIRVGKNGDKGICWMEYGEGEY